MAKLPSAAPATPTTGVLVDEVIAGLKKQPKELSSVWFYDELGSFLFDSICELPEYYITRTELQIMHRHAAEMAQQIGPGAALIELGSGTSLKTRILLDRLQAPHAYIPVDISREHLLHAAGQLARDYPSLRIIPVCADFSQTFELPKQATVARRRVVYFPGSTLGNFTQQQAFELLMRLNGMVGAGGAVLIGIDLQKDRDVLRRAYDDATGITAKFNLNALRHVNRELGADFDLNAFEHEAIWIENQSRIEMRLVSKWDQVVHLGNEAVTISRNERLRTEYCHKYTLESFSRLAASAGFSVEKVWVDPEELFSVQLLVPRTQHCVSP